MLSNDRNLSTSTAVGVEVVQVIIATRVWVDTGEAALLVRPVRYGLQVMHLHNYLGYLISTAPELQHRQTVLPLTFYLAIVKQYLAQISRPSHGGRTHEMQMHHPHSIYPESWIWAIGGQAAQELCQQVLTPKITLCLRHNHLCSGPLPALLHLLPY